MFAVYKTSQKKNFFPNNLQKSLIKVQRKYSENTVNCTSTAGPPRPIFGREGYHSSAHITSMPTLLPLSILQNPGKAQAFGTIEALPAVAALHCMHLWQNWNAKSARHWKCGHSEKLYYWKVVLFAVCLKTSFEKAKIFLFSTVKHATLSRRISMFFVEEGVPCIK